MKRSISILLTAVSAFTIFCGCTAPDPEKIFGEAVLNSNMFHTFAAESMYREWGQPSVKMVGNDVNNIVPMTRMEMLENKIASIEPNLKKIEALPKNDDTRAMIEASLALHNYILPVYKTEYKQLAKLYDDNAPQEQIDAMTKRIHDTYYKGFEERTNALIAAGKVYAAKHNINVRWDVGS